MAVTSYGYTLNCRYLGGYQRVDIAVVQNWLATFGLSAAAWFLPQPTRNL